VCGPDLTAHYRDPFDARIAGLAVQLDALIRDARQQRRSVPVSIERATADLWRWADRSLTPRGRQLRGQAAGQAIRKLIQQLSSASTGVALSSTLGC
jgi:hypothetical protein